MSQLQRVINLIKKTGDKALILDENGNPSYVIMSVFDYESLILGKSEVRGLTEEELLAKINREIAIWKQNQEQNNLPIDQYDFHRDLGDYYDSRFEEDDVNDYEELEGEFSSVGGVIEEMNYPFKDYTSKSTATDFNEDDEDRYYFEPVE